MQRRNISDIRVSMRQGSFIVNNAVVMVYAIINNGMISVMSAVVRVCAPKVDGMLIVKSAVVVAFASIND